MEHWIIVPFYDFLHFIQYITIQYNNSSSAQSYIKQIDCALQNVSERLRTKSNPKKICFKCLLECGMIVDEPYSIWETVPNIQPADRERCVTQYVSPLTYYKLQFYISVHCNMFRNKNRCQWITKTKKAVMLDDCGNHLGVLENVCSVKLKVCNFTQYDCDLFYVVNWHVCIV